ncbi:MAG TPA: rod shape-determining protein [Candidatus Limnocylindrales bacterium]|nr:rod shape-determining protein [Candidatus Limnocylindrales bacterium]
MRRDIAIDLGTANTRVYKQGEGIVFNEPTVVAMNASTGAVAAMGEEAWQMIGGRSGNIVAVRPLRHGVMTEFDITQRMIEVILRRVGVSRRPKPRVLACIASESSEIERRAVDEAVRFAGGKGVVLVEEALAAAIGAGLPIHEPQGNLIVDIGGGMTEMAVVSMGGVVSGRSIRVGGFDLDAAIAQHIRTTYGVIVGEKAAEQLKIAIGSAFPGGKPRAAIVTGREVESGAPREVRVADSEIRAAMAEPVSHIVEAARRTLAEAPPELTHDVLETGMFLTGGGGLLRGLDLLLSQECEVPVHLTERPLETVVLGAGAMLEHLDDYKSSFQLVRRRPPDEGRWTRVVRMR